MRTLTSTLSVSDLSTNAALLAEAYTSSLHEHFPALVSSAAFLAHTESTLSLSTSVAFERGLLTEPVFVELMDTFVDMLDEFLDLGATITGDVTLIDHASGERLMLTVDTETQTIYRSHGYLSWYTEPATPAHPPASEPDTIRELTL